jgi:hypothetical protein
MCQCYGCSNPADIVLTINRDLVRGKNEDLYRELAGEQICPFGARRYTLGSRFPQYFSPAERSVEPAYAIRCTTWGKLCSPRLQGDADHPALVPDL